MDKNLLILVITIVLFETLAISCVKQYYLCGVWVYLMLAALFYSIICYLLSLSFSFSSMGIVNVLWAGLSALAIFTIGALYYNEKINIKDIFGALLIITGVSIIRL